jgi:hypothetical protein
LMKRRVIDRIKRVERTFLDACLVDSCFRGAEKGGDDEETRCAH